MNEMQKPKRKKRSKWMLIICIIIAVLIILLISLGFFLANYSMNGKNQQTLEEARTWQEEHYDISWYDPMEKTDYTVTSYDGYVLSRLYG